MYYKLSNIAERRVLEREFGIPLEYANLYKPAQVINGLNEETLLVITSENKECISPAIWGILPEEFTDDWNIFQNISNTLNLGENDFYEDSWYSKAFSQRRCLVIITGFFTAFLHKGTIYPYYVKRRDDNPFCLAGIYNRLEDGFLTCSIITCQANGFTKKIQNLGYQMPLILRKKAWNKWLNNNLDETTTRKMLKDSCADYLEAYPIAKEFFNQNITFDSMLEPVSYKDLPEAVRA